MRATMKQNRTFHLLENTSKKFKTHKQTERTVGLHAENMNKQRLHKKD